MGNTATLNEYANFILVADASLTLVNLVDFTAVCFSNHHGLVIFSAALVCTH